MIKFLFTLLAALMLAQATPVQAANPPVLVAYAGDADTIDFGNGEVWYFFVMPAPATLGFFDFQYSSDAGATWLPLKGAVDFTDPNPDHQPFVSVWVNPAIPAPYVWYRYSPTPHPAIRVIHKTVRPRAQ